MRIVRMVRYRYKSQKQAVWRLSCTSCWITNSMEPSPSWEANRSSASQEIFCIVWNPKVHYRIHKCVPILSQEIQSITPHSTSWRSVFILYSHLRLGLPSCIFHSGLPPKHSMHLSCPPYVPHAPLNIRSNTGYYLKIFHSRLLSESYLFIPYYLLIPEELYKFWSSKRNWINIECILNSVLNFVINVRMPYQRRPSS